ncbi:hypothetical protein [Novosphingobium sp. 9U]|uniref:hypothetical protein n=1 Tax=Novosphingobium sp. 9U TaxID=2653158 RepID=UPI00135BCECE|nr:hypothetical protein [Novosphingobium sp. 9U]
MSDSRVWSIDRVAAAGLLNSLGIAGTPEAIEAAARHFSSHRSCAQDWAAERARSTAIDALEAASVQQFTRRSSDWAEGFRCAEEILMVMTAKELVPVNMAEPRSTGQVLRSMVREARRAN